MKFTCVNFKACEMAEYRMNPLGRYFRGNIVLINCSSGLVIIGTSSTASQIVTDTAFGYLSLTCTLIQGTFGISHILDAAG